MASSSILMKMTLIPFYLSISSREWGKYCFSAGWRYNHVNIALATQHKIDYLKLIKRNGPLSWPPRSPALTQLNTFLLELY